MSRFTITTAATLFLLVAPQYTWAAPMLSADTSPAIGIEERQLTNDGWELACTGVSLIGCVRDFGTFCRGRQVISDYPALCGRPNCICRPILVCEICKGEGEDGEEDVQGEPVEVGAIPGRDVVVAEAA